MHLDLELDNDSFLTPERASQADRPRLSALKEVARCWGQQVIRHYRWASKGLNYCNRLRAAARRVSHWGDAVLVLNWSILQRSRNVRQRPIQASVNPIEPHDLVCLKAWSRDPSRYKKLPLDDIPYYLGFDGFGLLVYKDFAAVLPPVDRARSLDFSSPPKGHSNTSAPPPLAVDNTRCQDASCSDALRLKEFPPKGS